MEELLKKFEDKKPEVVFEWQDAETDAEGWIVINSLRGGAAAGGAAAAWSCEWLDCRARLRPHAGVRLSLSLPLRHARGQRELRCV